MAKTEKEVKVKAYRTRSGKRVNPFRRRQKVGKAEEKPTNLKRNLAIGGSVLGAAVFLKVGLNPAKQITDNGIKNAAALAYQTSNSKKANQLFKQVLDSKYLSNEVKESFSQMTGASKTFFAQTVLSKSGYTKVSIHPEHNFSTWSKDTGEMISVGSVGTNVLSFETKPVSAIRGYSVFNMDFRVNHDYSRGGDTTILEARKLISQTKAMFEDHVSKLPDNAIMRAQPWSADGAGAKRDSIYQKFGFQPMDSAYSKDFLWGIKERGQFIKKPQAEQQEKMRGMINFSRKRVDPETRRKIGKGVKTHYDKKGRKKKIGLALGAAGLTGAGVGLGLLALKKRGPKLGTPQNPYVERAKIPALPDKTTPTGSRQASRSFTDVFGKFYRKGSFLPTKGKGVSDTGMVRRGVRPIDVTKQTGRSQEDLVKISVDASNTQASDKWLTIDVESKRFSRLVPYAVNFSEELDYTVPTKIQSILKEAISKRK